MPNRPIYEPIPLPDEDGNARPTSGLPHSSYQAARIRQIKADASEALTRDKQEIPSYIPATAKSYENELVAQDVSKNLAPAIESNMRKKLGVAPVGPLKPDEYKPISRQLREVTRYTADKIRRGEGAAPVDVAPSVRPTRTDARLDSDLRPAEPRTIDSHKYDVQQGRFISTSKPNPKFDEIAQDISSTHEKLAAKSPSAHPEVIDLALRKFVDKKYGPRTTDAHSDRIESHRADNYSDPKRFDAIADRLVGLSGSNKRGVTGTGVPFVSLQRGTARAPYGPLSIKASEDFPTIFHKLNGQWQEVSSQVLRRRAINESVMHSADRENEQEPEQQVEYEAPKQKKSRRQSDPAVTQVARILAKEHWNETPQGINAGKVKNPITGEIHPTFEKTSIFKNPMRYMSTKMGISDPYQHIIDNHSDKVLKQDELITHEGLPPLERGTGDKSPIPLAPFKGFATKFQENPVAAVTKARDIAAPPPSDVTGVTTSRFGTLATEKPAAKGRTRAQRNNAAFRGEA